MDTDGIHKNLGTKDVFSDIYKYQTWDCKRFDLMVRGRDGFWYAYDQLHMWDNFEDI